MVTVTLPIRTVNSLNERSHWAVKARRAKEQRQLVQLILSRSSKRIDRTGKLRVVLTRYGPNTRKMDSDGLAASFKHVRDSVADVIGWDDGDDRFTWTYQQQRDKDYSVKVEIHAE